MGASSRTSLFLYRSILYPHKLLSYFMAIPFFWVFFSYKAFRIFRASRQVIFSTTTEEQAGDDATITICFLPCHLSSEHSFHSKYVDRLIGILVECRLTSDEDRVLTRLNDHKCFQVVPWKHFTGDMACLDKAILLSFYHESLRKYLCLPVWKG